MKKINLFSRMWSSGGNSQSSDVGYDSRFTVGSPSGLESSTVLKFVSVLVLVLTIGVGNVWGAIASGTYVLINSTDDLEAGAHYIIANGTSGSVKCVSNVENANNRKTVAATVTDSKITVASDATIMTFTLGGSSGAWTFSTDNYAGTAGYLASAASGKNNYCRVISTAGTATISFSSDEAVINIGPHSGRTKLRYNTSDLFACYSSGQNAIYLYKLSASCAKKVALATGSPTGGTISFSSAGPVETCNGSVNVTMTITPNTGYYLSAYSPTGVSATTSPSIITGISATAVQTPTLTFATNANGTYTAGATFTAFVDHFIDNIQSTTGFTGEGKSKSGDYSGTLAELTLDEGDKTTGSDCRKDHYHFVGWVTAATRTSKSGGPYVAGDLATITGTATGTTYYAVWAKEAAGGGGDVSDVINNAATTSALGSTGTSSWASDFTVTGSNSSAVYTIHSMGINGATNYALQWNKNAYLYTSTAPSAGLKLKSITITTLADKEIALYGATSAYAAKADATSLVSQSFETSGTTYALTVGQLSSNYTCVGINGTTSSTQIVSITITYSGGVSYEDYVSDCAVSHTVSQAVSPAGKATVTLGATTVAEGGTTTAEYSDITTGYEFVNWSISGTGASLSSTTSNPTTITMGTANVTVTANLRCISTTATVGPTTGEGNYGWRYTPGETIDLTCSTTGATPTGYQWQKYIDDDWEDIDGATTARFQKASCTNEDGGSYRCVVTTGSGCSFESNGGDGYFVRIFTLDGNYDGSSWTKNAITWTGENTGTVTLSLNESRIYKFKVTDNDGKWFGYSDNNFIIQPWTNDCGTGNSDIRLFTGPAGNYTFTLNVQHAGDNPGPYVNIQVAYPSVTHPAEGYVYVSKWWDCYVHWWYNDGSDHALTTWGSDPQINTYATICENDYWYFPVLNTYNQLIVKNKTGDATGGNTTGDQTTDSHSGKYLTHDGSSWDWHPFATYSITFAGNGNDGGSMTNVNGVCPNGNRTLAENGFTKTGYHFDGWKTNTAITINTGGDDQAIAVNGIVSDEATIKSINSNITLTAQWEANTNTAYTVKHYQQNIADDNYTLFATQNLTGTTGASVTPAVNSYTGFTAPSTQTESILADGSLVIEYYYTRNSYTLTWVLNGGTVTTAGTCAAVDATGSPSGSVKFGASITAPIVAKTGYNMTWSSSPAATMPATATTYTANWTAKTTTISFNQNSGTGGQTTTKTATYGSAMPTTITTPTRVGYAFTGYFENSGGTGTKYYNADGSSATNWDKENATWTLYAGWTAKEDTYKTALHTGESGWTSYASGVTKSGAGYTIPAPSSVTKGVGSTCEDTHYHFAGWVTDANKEAGTISGNIIAATGTTDATGTTYWAVWEKETSGGATTIELNYSNLSVSTSSYAQSSATVGGVGFTINQGYRGGSNPNYLIQMNSSKGDGTLYNTTAISGLQSIKLYCATAGATATIYQGASEKPTSTSDPDERIGTAACAASTNYTINFTGSGEYFTLKVGGATYFSKIEVSYCTYEDPKAECEACVATPSITSVSLTSGTYSLTSVPVQATGASAGENCAIASYGFCWGTSANPTGNSTASANLSAGTFSATLTGPFSVGQTYYYRAFATNEAPNTGYSSDGTFTLRSVTFDLNGHGSSAPSTQYVLNGGKVSDPNYSESVTNWRFVGWYDEAACRDGHEWVFGTNTVSGANATIYAKWLPDPTVSFSVPTGVDAVASQRASVNLPTPTGFPSAVDDDCWAFAGWTESSSVNSTDKPATFYPAGAPYSGSQTSAFTLYAVYSRNKYLVVYDNDMLVADADYVISTWDGDTYAVVGTASGSDAEVVDLADNFHDKTLKGLHYYTLDNPTENAVWHLTGTTGSYVLQNKATGKYLDVAGASLISNSSATLAITEGTGEDKQTYKVTGGDNHLVISSSGASVATGDATYYFLYKLLSSKYMTTPAEPTFTVTWKVAGEDDQTSTVSACAGIQASDISALTIPGDDHLEIKNGGCITNTKGKFMGWSTHDYGSASGKGSSDFSDLFKTYDKAPYLTDDITLYAVFAEIGGSGDPFYEKVTSTGDISSDGRYLIVYETGAVAFNGELDPLDAVSNTIAVAAPEDDKITPADASARTAYAKAEFTIDMTNKYVKSASNKYIDRSSWDNGLESNSAATTLTSISIDGSGNLLIKGTGASGDDHMTLKYNKTAGQTRFRFFKSGQEDIALYKYDLGYTYSNYRTSCCAKKVTIGTPTQTGSGTVTFVSGGDAYAAGEEVATCAGATIITATVTPTNGYKCTVLEFTRSDSEDLTPDPAISVPFTGAQSYDLTFEQNADGVTLNTTVTFVALHDKYIDNMHYNATQDKSGNYGTAPTLSDETKGEQCTGLHYKFIGWIPESDMNMTTGVPTTTANMVTGGATGKYATGTNYYAIWAEEE